MLVEPSDSLQKGLLLGKLLHLDVDIAAHREAVHDVGVQVDLEGLARLDQNLL